MRSARSTTPISRPAPTSSRPTRSRRPRSRRPTMECRASPMSSTARARGWRARRRTGPTREDGRPRFVAGALGPTNRTASISPDVANPGFRAITFDQLRSAYGEQVRGLLTGGADLLLIETIFDTLNAKAAIYAIAEQCAARGVDVPVMISGTITDRSGRLLSGQTPEAFWNAIRHASPVSVGLNCALGAEQMRAHIADMARVCDTLICAYPNAGLPNEFGHYHEGPEEMARHLGEFADDRARQHRRRLLRHDARAHQRDCRGGSRQGAARGAGDEAACCGCRGWSRSRSRRKSPSSTSASAPTSPARRNSASSSPPATTRRRWRSRATRSRTARRSSTSTWTRACSIPPRR